MKSKVANPKRLIIGRIDSGEDLLLSLQKLAEEHGVEAGWFNVIGGLKRFSYGLFEHGNYHNIVKEAKLCCFELLPTSGNISIREGKIFAHCHIIASDEESGATFGGHLMEGTIVYPVAEVYLQECDAEISRTFDQQTKFWPMKF